MVFIYELKCEKTGFRYVGSTKNMSTRKSKHKTDLIKGRHYSPMMQDHFNKYGWENFSFILLETCTEAKRFEIENHFMEKIPKELLYNICLAGESPGIAFYRTEGRYTLEGIPMSQETKNKIGLANRGKKRSKKSKSKMSKARIGKSPWNIGTKGLMKANSGSFVKGGKAPLKGRVKKIIDGKIRYIVPNNI